MDEKQNAFQINREDNVATALTPLVPGPVELRGDACAPEVEAATEVPMGHKIALRDIMNGEDIVKYGVVIGRATADTEDEKPSAAFPDLPKFLDEILNRSRVQLAGHLLDFR